jgi:hypothetical protein
MADDRSKHTSSRDLPLSRRVPGKKVQAEAHAAFRNKIKDVPTEEQAAHAATRANTQRLRELRMARDAAAARERATKATGKKRGKASQEKSTKSR